MRKFKKDDEGISPVVAIIILVGITVVLAGVLYIWVSNTMRAGGMGKEGTPTAIFEVKNADDTIYTNQTDDEIASITMTEGQLLISEITVYVSGDGDTYIPYPSESEGVRPTPAGDASQWEAGETVVIYEDTIRQSEDENDPAILTRTQTDYVNDDDLQWTSTTFYVQIRYDPADKIMYKSSVTLEESTHYEG